MTKINYSQIKKKNLLYYNSYLIFILYFLLIFFLSKYINLYKWRISTVQIMILVI